MARQLGDLLEDARRASFVGRRAELSSFDAALAGTSPRRVLLLHGPGGIGKTTVLLEYRHRAPLAGPVPGAAPGRARPRDPGPAAPPGSSGSCSRSS